DLPQNARQGAALVLRTQQHPQPPGAAENSPAPLDVEIQDLLRGNPEGEGQPDDAAGRGADDEIEVVRDPPTRQFLEGRGESRREDPSYTATVQGEDPERRVVSLLAPDHRTPASSHTNSSTADVQPSVRRP